MLQLTNDQLAELPSAPSKDPVGEVYNLISNFSTNLSRYLEGTPGPNGLLQSIRPSREKFKQAVWATAPDFRPSERAQSNTEIDGQLGTILPTFLENEEVTTSAKDDKDAIFLDDVMKSAYE